MSSWDEWVEEALTRLDSKKVLRSLRPIHYPPSNHSLDISNEDAFQVFDGMRQWDRASVEIQIAESTFQRWLQDVPSSVRVGGSRANGDRNGNLLASRPAQLSTPTHFPNYPGRGGPPLPGGRHRGGGRGKDSLVGTTIKIRMGAYKGYKGRVLDVSGTSVQVELESQMKVVRVERNQIYGGQPMTPGGGMMSPAVDILINVRRPSKDAVIGVIQEVLLEPPLERPKGHNSSDEEFTLLETMQLWTQSNEFCPQGTVPIRRTTENDVLRASSLKRFGRKIIRRVRHDTTSGSHEHAVAFVNGGQYFGAKASINVWMPAVTDPYEFSLSQLWVISGSFGNDLNTVEAGWQVSPELYGDGYPRFFTYWTCPSQPGSTECGYYVLKFMKEIVEKGVQVLENDNIGEGADHYTDADLDEIREEWAQYVANFIFRS